jgi:hypothetical protein
VARRPDGGEVVLFGGSSESSGCVGAGSHSVILVYFVYPSRFSPERVPFLSLSSQVHKFDHKALAVTPCI